MGDRVVVRHVDEVSVVEMCEGENRWNSELVEALHEALDEVEATNGPQALVTTSTHPKAFSNGADLDWLAERNPDELSQFIRTASELQARMIGFPMPTIAAVNGHAFGMGMIWALCHDQRVMRSDRGFMCFNEIELGMVAPKPGLSLMRHKLTQPAFYDTVQFAKRWSAEEAFQSGFVHELAADGQVSAAAIARGQGFAYLGENRKAFGAQKDRIWGEESAITDPNGPVQMLMNLSNYDPPLLPY